MRILVTGGGGFLGGHIVKRLAERGDAVAALGRKVYSDLPDSVEQVQTDIRNREAVFQALRDRDAVVHAASVPGIWGKYADYFQTNVEGTRNVIEGCWKNNVKKLIYASSPSVVFSDSDLENVDESIPYPENYLCHYAETKALAEKLVLAANGVDGLATVSLRPHLIWGPGDPHLAPRLLERAKKGRLARVGEGGNLVDIVYIDNAVEAHLKAVDALSLGAPCAGKAYFISDGTAVVLWDWIRDLLREMKAPPVTKSISFRTAQWVGLILESIYGIFQIKSEPRMTRFLAAQLAKSHYFDISGARRDLGYAPLVGPEDGMKRLIEYLQSRPED